MWINSDYFDGFRQSRLDYFCFDLGSHNINIKQHFTIQLTCPICLNQYDFDEHIPMIICSNQHYICLLCIEKSFEYVPEYQDQIPCHFCKEPVFADCVDRFRLMEEFIHTSNAIETYGQNVQALIDNLVQENKKLERELEKQRKAREAKPKTLKAMLQACYMKTEAQQSQGQIKHRGGQTSRKNNRTSVNKSSKDKKRQDPNRELGLSNNLNLTMKTERFPSMNSLLQQSLRKDYAVYLRPHSLEKLLQEQSNLPLDPSFQEDLPLSSKKHRSISMINRKKPLPYVITNPKKITAQDLKRVMKNETINNKHHKQIYVTILAKYDFSILKQLDLSKVGLHQKDFQKSDIQGSFPNLQSLNLSKNRFTCIPTFVIELISLKNLNISKNAIVKVSSELVRLHRLENLDLWNNQLKTIPEVLYLMKKLIRVDLSNNKINSVQPWFYEAIVKIDLFGNPVEMKNPTIFMPRANAKPHKTLKSNLSKSIM